MERGTTRVGGSGWGRILVRLAELQEEVPLGPSGPKSMGPGAPRGHSVSDPTVEGPHPPVTGFPGLLRIIKGVPEETRLLSHSREDALSHHSSEAH